VNNDLISISMGSYNGSKYVSETLDSIISQTYKNWELIVTDDGSTDNTLEILQGYAKKDSRIQVIHQDNKGPSYARYNGYKLAKGKYFIYSDDDDLWLPDMLQDMMDMWVENDFQTDFISTTHISFSTEEEMESLLQTGAFLYGTPVVYDENRIKYNWAHLDCSEHGPDWGWGCLFKMSFLKSFESIMESKKNVLPVHFFDDAYYSTLFITHAKSFLFTNKAHILYRIRSSSISHTGNISIYNKYLMYARNESLAILRDVGWYEAYQAHLLGFMLTLIRTWYLFEKYGKADAEYPKIMKDMNEFYYMYLPEFKLKHYKKINAKFSQILCLLYRHNKRLLFWIISKVRKW